MRKVNYYLLSFILFFTSFSLSAQTYSTGREAKKADINFTEVANYYKLHPLPSVRKNPLDEDEEEENPRPSRRRIDPSQIHIIDRNSSERVASTTSALPIAQAPNDTFLSTTSDGTNIPPDTHGAVDSQYCVSATNTYVRIQSRTGALVSQITIDAFWNSIRPSGTDGYDPRIHYDPNYKRWIFVTDDINLTTQDNSYLFIAVSATNNPTGTWHMYSVSIDPTNATWLDFPNVGFNNKWITVAGNMFTTAGHSNGAVLYVFNYASIMAGTGAPYTKITESSSFALCPAQTFDPTQASEFCLEISRPTSGKLELWKITGAVGSPTIASVGYPTTTTHWQSGGSADFVPQLGTANMLQAGDGRIYNVVYRNQKLWCSHTAFLPATGTATRCSIMWWQIDTLANPIQNGLIDDPVTPSFFDYPNISVNINNDALVGFSYCSANMYPSAAYAMHLNTDPADSMRHPYIFRHGQANYYVTFGGTQNRWGDYSATVVDPVNNVDFWTEQESVPSSDLWNTWWAYIKDCPVSADYTVTKSIINKNLNDTIDFTGTDPTGTVFTWNYGGGTVVSGSGAGPIVVKWATYGWKVITLKDSLDGCSETFKDSVLVENKAGVDPLNSGNESAKIIPNPNNGSFDIVFNASLSGSLSINLINENGQTVYHNHWDAVNDNKVSVNTDNLSPGIYIANIYIDDNLITEKINITR